MNGAAAAFAAAEEDLAGIVGLSAVPEFQGTEGLARASEVTEPCLFVAGESDGTAAADAQAYADAVAGEAEVIIYPSGQHGTSLLSTYPEFVDKLLEFLAANS